MSSVKSNILSLKYQRFKTSGTKDIGVRIFEFVAKTQLLSNMNDFKIIFQPFKKMIFDNKYSDLKQPYMLVV